MKQVILKLGTVALVALVVIGVNVRHRAPRQAPNREYGLGVSRGEPVKEAPKEPLVSFGQMELQSAMAFAGCISNLCFDVSGCGTFSPKQNITWHWAYPDYAGGAGFNIDGLTTTIWPGTCPATVGSLVAEIEYTDTNCICCVATNKTVGNLYWMFNGNSYHLPFTLFAGYCHEFMAIYLPTTYGDCNQGDVFSACTYFWNSPTCN